MSVNKSKYWFVPRRHLFVPRGMTGYRGAALRRADSPIDHDIDQCVGTGNSFTLLLKSFYVVESYDKGDNDLLVRSWTKYGSQPKVEVAHFFKKNVPNPYFCRDELLAHHMFSVQHYQDQNLVWVNLQVLEIDGKKVDNLAAFVEDDLADVMQLAGAVFPGTLPFIGNVADRAFELFKKLKVLVSNKNDVVFETALDLCSVDSGETPFRYGVYIFFSEPVAGEQYRLREFKIEPAVDVPQAPIPDYAVIEVVPEVMNTFKGDDILVNQNLAAGLMPFSEESANQGEKDERFQYLQTLMKQAKLFDDLLEYRDLCILQHKGKYLNEFQRNRLQNLSIELKDYIEYIADVLHE